jgi:hypothetical protein
MAIEPVPVQPVIGGIQQRDIGKAVGRDIKFARRECEMSVFDTQDLGDLVLLLVLDVEKPIFELEVGSHLPPFGVPAFRGKAPRSLAERPQSNYLEKGISI